MKSAKIWGSVPTLKKLPTKQTEELSWQGTYLADQQAWAEGDFVLCNHRLSAKAGVLNLFYLRAQIFQYKAAQNPFKY